MKKIRVPFARLYLRLSKMYEAFSITRDARKDDGEEEKNHLGMMGSKTTQKPETELSKHLHFQESSDATSKQLNSSPHITISRLFHFKEL